MIQARKTTHIHIAALYAVLLLACLGPACAVRQTKPPEAATAIVPADLLPNGRLTEDGMLLGGQPTPEQLQAIRDAGFRTVIDMRLAEEGGTTRVDIEAAGMNYATLPTAGAAGMTETNARTLAKLIEDSEGPLVLHCASGNRVGGLLALKAFYVDGAAPEAALELGLADGMTRLEPTVRGILGIASPED